MTALSIQPPFPIFADTDGRALEAGYVWLGVAGADPIASPITAYWDEALTQVVTQPVRTRGGFPLNGAAIGRLYVNSDYSILVRNRNGFDIYSAANATERYGNVISFADITGTLGSDRVTFLQAGTGAVSRTAQSKMRDTVSVKDFGAVGDGVADDTAAIQAALTASKSVFIPAGTYRVSSISVLYSGNDGYLVKGAGRNITKFVADGTVSNFFTVGSPVALTGYGNYSTFEDFTIDMTSMANSSSSRGLFLRDGYTHSFNRITIIGVANTNKVPLYIGNRVYACAFKDCDFWSSSVGTGGKVVMVGTPATVESTPTANSFINCAMQSVSMDTCANTSFFGCIIQGDETPKVTTTACRGTLFTGCDFEGGGTLYNLDTASVNFRSIGNDITAFSGTYLGANLPGGGYTFNDFGFRVSASSGAPIQFDTVEFEGWKHLANVAGLQREVHKNTSTNPACAMDLAITANTASLIVGLDQSNAYIEASGPSGFSLLRTSGVTIAEWGNYSFRSGIDGSINLGDPTHRWGTVYAATGTINTSDEREKQDIAALSAAEKRVAVALKGLVKKFRFKDAVQAKGDAARIHVGVIAQEVMAAFEAENLDPMRYGIVCYDQWGAEGDRPAGDRYGVRYEELLAFIISAM